ncbi:MAG: AAA family ATPase [Actinobacteria bacterium]|nr:AAA family ATPase [Actinomycetota bacterium]
MLDSLERRLFVGRESELATFRGALTGSPPPLLLVLGSGGSGKSTLLRAFARLAREEDRTVVEIDGGSIAPSPDALLRALGGTHIQDTVEGLNRARTVLLIDDFVSLRPVSRFLFDMLLPELEPGCRVVIASRLELPPDPWVRLWRPIIRTLRLAPFTPAEMNEYLTRRGIDGAGFVDSVAAATGGLPLAVALAADLAEEMGTHDLATVGGWNVAVRTSAERLLRDVDDPDLRELLEAATVVHTFDEPLLRTMTDHDVAAPLARLAHLSIVAPVPGGLRLHEHVRAVLAQDLRWRDPDRHTIYRVRAASHLAERMRDATGDDLAWLVEQRLYLWQNALVKTLLFDEADVAVANLTPLRVEDRDGVLDFWRRFVPRSDEEATPGDELAIEVLARLVDHPGEEIMVARDRDGRIVAVAVLARVASDSLDALPADVVGLAETWLGPSLPERCSTSDVYYVGPIVADPRDALTTTPALRRHVLSVLTRGGRFLTVTRRPMIASLLELLGFHPHDTALADHEGRRSFVLRLAPHEVVDWVEAVISRIPVSTTTPRQGPLSEVASGPELAEPAVSGEVTVRVLGGLQVRRGDADVTPPAGVPAQAVKILAVSGGQLHVEQLAERLWPDVDADRGRRRMRNVVARVRESCGDIVVRDGDVISFREHVVIDLVEIERDVRAALAAAAGSRPPEARTLAQRAVDRYAGELLPADPYDAWTVAPRERARRWLVIALDLLADAARDEGRIDDAVALLEEGIEADPYDETRYVRAVRVLLAAGRHARAATVLARARRHLAELGLEPSAELASLELRLRD